MWTILRTGVNRDAAMTGAAPVEGHTPEWHAANALRIEKMKARFSTQEQEIEPANVVGG